MNRINNNNFKQIILYANCPFETETNQYYKILEELEEVKEAFVKYKYAKKEDKEQLKLEYQLELKDLQQAIETQLIQFNDTQIEKMHLQKMTNRYEK